MSAIITNIWNILNANRMSKKYAGGVSSDSVDVGHVPAFVFAFFTLIKASINLVRKTATSDDKTQTSIIYSSVF